MMPTKTNSPLGNIAKIILLLLIFVLASCGQPQTVQSQPPEAVDGVLDLRDWDFARDGSINLEGEWRMVWHELLEPEAFASSDVFEYVPVPESWIDYEIDGEELPSEGYATFMLTLLLPDDRPVYGLFNEGQGSAYKMWVDGELLGSQGVVGTSFQTMAPDTTPTAIFFEPEEKSVELVIQISNFNHRKGGFRNSLLLGLAQPIHQYQMVSWFVEVFSIGSLLVMGLYHIFIFAFRTKTKPPLYFAILCFMMLIRVGVTNQDVFLVLFPILDWATALRLEYLVFYLTPVVFLLFFQSLYPEDIHRWFVWVVVALGVGFTLPMPFIDTLKLSYTASYYQIVYLLEMVYCIYFLARIFVKKREGAVFVGAATLVVFAGVLVEIFYLRGVFSGGQIAPYTFLAFFFVQAILMSSRFSKSFRRVETLSGELEISYHNLRESERKFRKIFEDSKDIIVLSDLDTQIEDISPSVQDILGYTKEELRDKNIIDLLASPERLPPYLESLMKTGNLKDIEVELVRKDGQKIFALVSVAVRQDEDGNMIGYQGTVRDLSAKKQAEVARLRAMQLEQIAITDPLTKIYNRRFFYEVAEKELERIKRSNAFLSVIMFDIDHFKNINDTFGHMVGDQVLVSLADVCAQNIRTMDVFSRFGGEEFVVLMLDADQAAAYETAERLRRAVEAAQMAVSNADTEIRITISLGVVTLDSAFSDTVSEILTRADQALYLSKESGRNRVTVWQEDSPQQK